MKQWLKLSKEEQEKRMNLQAIAEEDMIILSEKKYWQEYDVSPDEGKPEQSLLDTCVINLTPLFQAWIDYSAKNPKTPSWALPLFGVGAGKMADITVRCLIIEWFNASLWDRKPNEHNISLPTAQHIAHAISEMVIDIIGYQQTKSFFKEDWLKQSHYQRNWSPKRCKAFVAKMGGLNKSSFTRKNREDFGHHMLRIVEKSNVINIFNIRRNTGKRWCDRVVVSFTNEILQELHKRHTDVISYAALLYRPMLVPPVPHTTTSSGGNLLPYVRKPVVQRFKDVMWDETVVQRGSTPSEMVVEGLNGMMHTEWSINERVYEVMNNLFRNNTRACNLPAYEFSAFDYPEPYPKDGAKEEQAKWCAHKQEAYSNWYKEERARGRMLVRLKLAKDMTKHRFFYQLYTCDFRGRANSACDLLSPQSSDFDRGLIHFANTEKQTPSGVYWLKVHLANLFDRDKESFGDRVKWVDDNMDMIKEINKDPYGTLGLWMSDKKKKNPSFQRLSAIFELCRTDGLTQLPIQMDGSCNGVQHWAALMKTGRLAEMVNLVKTDKPQDLYQYVANLITDIMDKDKENDTKSGLWAKQFLDHWGNTIHRNVVKRAVMTDPYGVTLFGIRRYCRSEGHLDWVSKDKMAGAVMELATFIDKALKETLIEPNKGKVWLKAVADIASELNKNLEWTTPCGFNVVHQYCELVTRRSVTKLFNMKELYFGYPDKDTIDPKQVNLAISPNYIHSLDASHMWCTIRRMLLSGIDSLSMVHDSYGCHAPYVPMMREYTKEEFCLMHKQPLLENLKIQLEKILNVPLPELPSQGQYDITETLNSEYLFQ
jgi:DNA-directed RNA polymerase